MASHKLSLRQVQASKTKTKIIEATKSLIAKHGLNNFSVKDVCKASGVGIGTFYHYYNSKYSLLFSVENLEEIFYKEYLDENAGYCSHEDKILIYFNKMAEFTDLLSPDKHNQVFLQGNNLFFEVGSTANMALVKIIEDAQADNTFSKEYTTPEIVDFITSQIRGLSLKWHLNDRKENLADLYAKHIRMCLKVFKSSPSVKSSDKKLNT